MIVLWNTPYINTGAQCQAFNSGKTRSFAIRSFRNRQQPDEYTFFRRRSSPWLRATVPGQVAYDNARTSIEAGSYFNAGIFFERVARSMTPFRKLQGHDSSK
jgi:hypothetical protein